MVVLYSLPRIYCHNHHITILHHTKNQLLQNLCLGQRVYCPFQKGLPISFSLSYPDIRADKPDTVSQTK